ncbi:MAG: PAS domain-containing protein [Sphingobium sp.]
METLRGHDAANDQENSFYAAEDHAIDAPSGISANERRMHVRAYNYWASLLGDRMLPSIEDLNPDQIEDFGPHSVLLDFTAGIENPAVVYLGTELRRECEIVGQIDTIGDVPTRSLLSRLTDHYLQIIANAAPIGFEAEFINQRGAEIMYRGILMPFSSDDDTIDFVYGVINWKEMANRDLTDALAEEVDQALRSAPMHSSATPVWADGPSREADAFVAPPENPNIQSADEFLPELELTDVLEFDSASPLADWLVIARECAQEAGHSDARSRGALYRAIGLAYDFALVTQDSADDYAEMLADAGIKVQLRSPMTAVIKLIFGADYDKTRVTEYAAALEHARTRNLEPGTLWEYLEQYAGGLKGLVRDERAARRTDRPDPVARKTTARSKLKGLAAMETSTIATDEDGFAILVGRREADGSLSIVAALPRDSKLAGQVILQAAD